MPVVPPRVSPEEDGVLRRLHGLERHGARLAPPLRELKDEIRARDQRLEVREPQDLAELTWSWDA